MASIREMTPEDGVPVTAVLRRNGLTAEGGDGWLNQWESNPFRDTASSMGWVLEHDDGSIVGAFGNLPLGYEWNGSPVRVAAACGWAVDPMFRRDSIKLFRRFLRQRDVDLLLTSTASSRVGEIFSAARFRPVPHAEYDKALFWVTDARGFAASALRHLRVPLANMLSAPAGLALRGVERLSHRRGTKFQAQTIQLAGFDGRFDTFWERLRRQRDRLLAVRSLDALSWHFKSALDRARLAILALEEGGELLGYIIMIRHDHDAIGLTRYRVADLQILGDARSRGQSLVVGALHLAADQGVHVVEVVGLESSKREALSVLSPRRRQLPSWLFYYRPLDQRLEPYLAAPSAWDPSPFDGDASL
jgi:hypothetical protein